jgi:hypothetical protein
LNTEIALTIDSPELAASVAALIIRDMQPENAWRVTLTDDNWLLWTNDETTRWGVSRHGGSVSGWRSSS